MTVLYCATGLYDKHGANANQQGVIFNGVVCYSDCVQVGSIVIPAIPALYSTCFTAHDKTEVPMPHSLSVHCCVFNASRWHNDPDLLCNGLLNSDHDQDQVSVMHYAYAGMESIAKQRFLRSWSQLVQVPFNG